MQKMDPTELPEALRKLNGLPEVLRIEDVAALIGKAPTTIRTCATNKKYAHLIPRPFKLPSSRRLCWYRDEVLAWMAMATPIQPCANKKKFGPGPSTKAERAAAKRVGLTVKEWRATQ
ncbi:helix-turn-helix transcriptional regulator [Ralstonia sp. R-29]|uniref:helix-turn-helix transcriptional regulator n=1 Tax=Ralstonia sp. R-29 TaxID=3404059 RepID=UPI003CF9A885